MRSVDQLLNCRYVVPVEPHGLILSDHTIVMDEERIVDILPTERATKRYRSATTIERRSHVAIPGLVNAHTHAAMSLLRGLADDLPLDAWLNDHIWPAERRLVSEHFVQLGTRLAAAEMLRGGTTCFSDMYFFPDLAGRVAEAAGIRSVVGLIVIDAPTVWANDADEYFAKATRVHDEFRHSNLVSTAFAPHAPYSVSDEALRRVAVLGAELDLPVHIHLHETQGEVDMAREHTGQRPLARLHELGLVTPRLVAVHMTALTNDERDLLAHLGGHVVHCPESNLKLASGYCAVGKLLARDVNVALGTDGAASNNDLDMLGEMRTAALLAKGQSGDPRALDAATALRMATLGGARALGLGHEIGTLEKGKQADIVVIDLGRPETQPVYNPTSQLVYAVSREAVCDVWVAGKPVLRERELTQIDLGGLLEEVAHWFNHSAKADSEQR